MEYLEWYDITLTLADNLELFSGFGVNSIISRCIKKSIVIDNSISDILKCEKYI